MRTLLISSLLILLAWLPAQSQTRIDGNFSFQTNPAKGYSIYVPSGYNANTANTLMVGMHPLNTARWDAISWCDTLIDFAEMNGLLLVCPDGGANGSVVDPIDTAFTTALLDSMYNWYNIDQDRIYIMGFSFGGRGTYTYGLSNPNVFSGFLPIGAAITNTNEVNVNLQANSSCKPFYLVHGGNDSPNTRFYPIRTALMNNGAIVNSLLMPGVGHTIDFPNRNQILSTAFQWIDSVNVNTTVPVANFSFSVSGDSVSFSDASVGSDTWAWDFGDGNSSTIANPTHAYAPGNYNACLTITNQAGCTSTFCDSVQVVLTGIDIGLPGSISYFPNPANSHLNLSWNDRGPEATTVSILDITGRTIASFELLQGLNNIQVNTSEFATGLYIGRIQSGDAIESFKFKVSR